MMNKRMMVSVFLACAVAISMTGCKGFFGKKSTKDGGITDVQGTGTADGLGVNGTGGTRIEGTGSIVDAQLVAIQFAFDSAQVADTERAKAEAAASYLKANSGTFVTLEGHCDERGSAEYNMSLGERRAQSVRTYLMNLGPHPDQELRLRESQGSRPRRKSLVGQPSRRVRRNEAVSRRNQS
jgi:peptidoglycan-associated lipoprotein